MSNVIDIGEYKFTQKHKSWTDESCKHKHMTLDENGDFVTCDDCKIQLSAWYVLNHVLQDLDEWRSKLMRQAQVNQEANEKTFHLKVTQNLERVWRGKLVPACPHCGEGILLQDRLGSQLLNKEVVIRRRQVQAEKAKSSS